MAASSKSALRRGFGIAAALAITLIVLAGVMQWREAADADVLPVALNPDDPAQARLGALIYRGGLDIPRMGQNIGGLSALRWDEQSGRLIALTDDARWVWITPVEEDGALVGIGALEVGDLLGLRGEALSGKAQGDSESLTRATDGGWLIGFERYHRVWRYAMLSGLPKDTDVDPVAFMGPLEPNGGTETLAGDEKTLLICAERDAPAPTANCFWKTAGMRPSPMRVEPPGDMRGLGAVPTDADIASDGRVFTLFRSYDPSHGPIIGVTALRPDGSAQELATLRAPFTVDNFEGLAVREEEGKTFLYMVSDDNFSSNQRTLLMKFAIAPAGG